MESRLFRSGDYGAGKWVSRCFFGHGDDTVSPIQAIDQAAYRGGLSGALAFQSFVANVSQNQTPVESTIYDMVGTIPY